MKKVICMILVVINILSVSAFAGAQLAENQKADLYNLGIMTGDENGDLRLGDTITRAEAVKMICAAGKIDAEALSGEAVFPDVSSNHWAYDYICAAKEAGIIIGDEKGNFNPEANITNEEIIKMVVCLLGYDVMAEEFGAYPAGYRFAATQIGITAGMQLETNTPAVRNDVGIMIYNALDIPLLAEKEDDEQVYVKLDGTGGSPYVTLRGRHGAQ